jgi:hypothetical protein
MAAFRGLYCSFITELQQWGQRAGPKVRCDIGFRAAQLRKELAFEVSNPTYRTAAATLTWSRIHAAMPCRSIATATRTRRNQTSSQLRQPGPDGSP